VEDAWWWCGYCGVEQLECGVAGGREWEKRGGGWVPYVEEENLAVTASFTSDDASVSV
jgi:hypothetical protein